MKKIKHFIKNNKSLIILICLMLVAYIVKPSFYKPASIRNLLLKVSIQGIIGLGMTFTLLAGEFDMSVGSVLTLCGIIFASLLSTTNFYLAVIITLLIGLLLGIINGLLVSKLKINSFIATLGVQYAYKAIALIISNGQPIKITDSIAIKLSSIRIFKNTIFPFIFFALWILTLYILKRTRFGRNIYATGGNYEVAKNSGINVEWYKTMSFVAVCFTASIAGILMAIRLQTATTIAGDDVSLTVISSVIVGGTSTVGGIGGAYESLIGLFIISIATSLLDAVGISGYTQQVVQGLLIVVIIGITSLIDKRKK